MKRDTICNRMVESFSDVMSFFKNGIEDSLSGVPMLNSIISWLDPLSETILPFQISPSIPFLQNFVAVRETPTPVHPWMNFILLYQDRPRHRRILHQTPSLEKTFLCLSRINNHPFYLVGILRIAEEDFTSDHSILLKFHDVNTQ